MKIRVGSAKQSDDVERVKAVRDAVGDDVDLMVVGRLTRRQLSSAIRQAKGVLQREINAVFYSLDEYNEELEDSNSFTSRVHHGRRIDPIAR